MSNELAKNKYTDMADWEQYINRMMKDKGGVLYSSSGSTNTHRNFLYTEDVFNNAIFRTKELLSLTPLTKEDDVCIFWGYGQFPPAHFYTKALSELGNKVYPLGSGRNISTKRKIVILNELRPTVFIGMPSYLLKIGHLLEEQDSLSDIVSNVKLLITGGEKLTIKNRDKLKSIFNTDIYDHYGMIQAPMIAGECTYGNMHVSKSYDAEVLVDGEVHSKGEGELLLSSKTAWYPLEMNRVKTNDVVVLSQNCQCDFDGPVILVKGRSDMKFKIRGQLIDIQEIHRIMELNGFGNKFHIEIRKEMNENLVLYLISNNKEERIEQELDKIIPIKYSIVYDSSYVIPLTLTGKIKLVDIS